MVTRLLLAVRNARVVSTETSRRQTWPRAPLTASAQPRNNPRETRPIKHARREKKARPKMSRPSTELTINRKATNRNKQSTTSDTCNKHPKAVRHATHSEPFAVLHYKRSIYDILDEQLIYTSFPHPITINKIRSLWKLYRARPMFVVIGRATINYPPVASQMDADR